MKKIKKSSTPPVEQPIQTDMGGFDPSLLMGMMGGQNIPPMPPADDNIIDVEVSDTVPVNDEENLDVVTEFTPVPPEVVTEEESNEENDTLTDTNLIIKAATPLEIRTTNRDNAYVSTLVFICKDENDKLFTLSINLSLESFDELDFVNELPFTNNDDTFVSTRIANKFILSGLDNYVSQGDYIINEGFESDTDPYLYINAVNSKTMESSVLKMSAEVFSGICFIESYVTGCINNKHDLSLASTIIAKEQQDPTTITVVDKIDRIVSMASANIRKKGIKKLISKIKGEEQSTSIGLVLKVYKYDKDQNKVSYILTPFDIGKSYDKEKFKGATIDSIQKNFYGESDQFVSTLLMLNTNLNVRSKDGELGNKEYMIIRGKTKDHNVKLFLFDNTLVDDLVKLIDEY